MLVCIVAQIFSSLLWLVVASIFDTPNKIDNGAGVFWYISAMIASIIASFMSLAAYLS
jgi:hypothetical protein